MFKYIITWVVVSTHISGGPISAPLPDKFGRVESSSTVSAVAYFSETRVKHSKTIRSRDSAVAFYKDAFSQTTHDLIGPDGDYMEDVKIDSIKIRK